MSDLVPSFGAMKLDASDEPCSSTVDPEVVSLASQANSPFFYKSKQHTGIALAQANRLRQSGTLCDVTLIVGETRIPAHRLVLSACSSYFHAMFTTEMTESRLQEIQMIDIDDKTLEALVEFCYTGTLAINGCNVQLLLPAACLLQLSEVQAVCCEYLRDQLDPTNCLGIRAFAEMHACKDLVKIADKFIFQNFKSVATTEEFRQMPLKMLTALLGSEELCVDEESVYQAAIIWVKHDVKNRKPFLAEVLEKVRLPQCSPKFLVSVVGEDKLIKADERCRDLLDEAKNYILLPDERHKMKGPRMNKRRPHTKDEVLFAVGGWCNGDAIASVERMDPTTGEWRLSQPMGKRRCGVGVAVVEGMLYAVGGHDGQSYLNSVERYDCRENVWLQDVAPTSTCRTSVGVTVLEGHLYAVGGQDGISCLNVVEKYDPRTNTWTKVAPMGSRRLGVSVSVLNGYIYAVGGSDGQSPLNSVERYDPRTNKWTPVKAMSTARKHLGTAVYNGFLYAVGGRDDGAELSTCEKYNPETNEWSPVVSMTSKRSGVALAVVSGKLYALGGFDGYTYLKTVEVYDEKANQWRLTGSMAYRRLGGGVGVLQVSKPIVQEPLFRHDLVVDGQSHMYIYK
ncbi:hypothetical protein QR680_007850 [Steinernema hermaphroditum]|uniref:BTB domain-containing protein n=1 Tax=Steinernema hermaphroditum TaxID=289476 RepID=A0AA39IGM6_9BILA|nr:hypothetical protein QR680_007850 [Steinernema hermaphroditum]